MWGAIDAGGDQPGRAAESDGRRHDSVGQLGVQFDAEHVTSLDGGTYLIVRYPDMLDVEVTVLERPVGEQQVTPKSRGAAP